MPELKDAPFIDGPAPKSNKPIAPLEYDANGKLTYASLRATVLAGGSVAVGPHQVVSSPEQIPSELAYAKFVGNKESADVAVVKQQAEIDRLTAELAKAKAEAEVPGKADDEKGKAKK